MIRNPLHMFSKDKPKGKGLIDPLNRDSEIAPQDRKGYEQHEPTDDAQADIDLVYRRFKDEGQRRRQVERDWVLACSFREGNQWLGWNDATHRVVSMMNPKEKRRYITDNQIGPLVDKTVALATQNKPDANVSPDSDAPKDRQAASEARAITAHLYRLNGGAEHTKELAYWAVTCSVGYILDYWDKNLKAAVPMIGPDGQIAGKQLAKVGEAQSPICSPFEIYIDTQAKRWKDANWVIRAKVQPLSWFVETYGDIGKKVEPDNRDAGQGYIDGYAASGDSGSPFNLQDFFSSGAKYKAALLLEMWEKPTPRYPEGRFIAVAGKVRLTGPNTNWPQKPGLNGGFPFARCVYKEAANHPYGIGLVRDLIPLQIGYNRAWSKIVERIESDKLTVMSPMGAREGSDVYEIDDTRNVRVIKYDATNGPPPSYQQAPQVGGDTWNTLQGLKADMQDIAGIHDVSQGQVPAGVTAGTAIDLLQQGDRTTLSLFTSSIEQARVESDTNRINLYAQNASSNLPRMMGVGDSGDPEQARMQVMSFRALTDGGSCSVVVEPGSATPKTPAGEIQEIMDMANSGLFGDLADPNVSIQILTLIASKRSNPAIEKVIAMKQEALANQPNEEQAKLQAQQQMQEAQQQAEAERLAITEQSAERMEQVKTQNAMQLQAAKHQELMQQMAHKGQIDILTLSADKKVPKISGTIDPVAMVALEKILYGVDGKVPPQPAKTATSTKSAPKKPAK